MITKIGLDLGFSNITISDVTSGISREAAIALIDRNTNRILSLGNAAMSVQPEEGQDAVLVRPFKNGLLYSAELTSAIIENAIAAVLPADSIRCVLGIASDMNPKQQKELYAMLLHAGVQEVYGARRAVAALIGAGYAPGMSVISVNIGASATDIAVLYEGIILTSQTAMIGGEDFDKAVKQYIFEQGDVNVSLSVARAIKEKLGAVWPGKSNEELCIEGTLSLTGNRINMTVSTEDILGVFEKPLQSLLMAIADAVKKIPPENVEAIFKNGIVLSGGMAQLYGLDKMIEKVLDIPVCLAQAPMDCVAKGLSRINVFLPERMRSHPKDLTPQLAKFYENRKNKKGNA